MAKKRRKKGTSKKKRGKKKGKKKKSKSNRIPLPILKRRLVRLANIVETRVNE